MPRREPSQESRRAGDRLRALSLDPAAQADFAAGLLTTARDPLVLDAALKVLEGSPRESARAPLLALYAELDAAPSKRDAGGMTRAAILRALRPVATTDDAVLFERASRTYEPSPADSRGPVGVRAAGLAGLVAVDPPAAMVRAAQLLWDWENASRGDGEPVGTAVRALAALDQQAALITFLLEAPPSLPEACAEAYRALVGLPGAVLRDLLAPALRAPARPDRPPVIPVARDDLALLGLVDLLVEHERDGELLPLLGNFAASPISLDLYHYLVSAVVARRRPAQVTVLIERADLEMDRDRLAMLAEALGMLPGPEAAGAVARIEERLASRDVGRGWRPGGASAS